MYNPRWFKEERVEVLQRAIETISFGTFVTSGKAGLLASHIPMMVDRSEGKFGTIQGHVARGNNQWRDRNGAIEGLRRRATGRDLEVSDKMDAQLKGK